MSPEYGTLGQLVPRRFLGIGCDAGEEERMAPPSIAIVDDDDSFRLALSRIVRSHNLEITTYASGEAFLDALPETVPSCVLLDLDLPGLGGLDVLHHLAEGGSAIPVIVMTGVVQTGLRETCLAAGAAAFLTKPIGAADFARALGEALAKGEPRT
jgi:FixJ family two-component response regulator